MSVAITRRTFFRAIAFLILNSISSCIGKPTPLTSSTAQSIPVDALVVKNGVVIDGTGAPPIPDGVVIIVKDKIYAVGHASDFSIPPETKVVDAKGGTIMPGIINSHVHHAESPLIRKYYYLIRGVTSVGDLGSSMQAMPQFVDNSTIALTARGFRTGPLINVPHGYPGDGELLYAVTNPEEARRAVADLVNRGADMIKTALDSWNSKLPWEAAPPGDPIPNLDLPTLRAIVEEGHRYGKIVRVHLASTEFLELALDAGVDSVEHIPLPRLKQIDFQAAAQNGGYAKLSAPYEALLARMVQQHVFMVPTLDQIVPWCEGFGITPERKKLCSDYALAPVHRFHQMGGIIALGDDSSAQLRRLMPVGEMKRLAQAGLSLMEIIQAGTKYAAQVCGQSDKLGTLEPGKLADVIVVNGDPLAHIEIMDQVSSVIIGGKIAVPCDPIKQNIC